MTRTEFIDLLVHVHRITVTAGGLARAFKRTRHFAQQQKQLHERLGAENTPPH